VKALTRRLFQADVPAVKSSPKHLLRDGHAKHVARKFDVRGCVVYAVCPLEHLNHGLVARNLEHLARALLAIAKRQIHDLAISRALS
jgi:hypothetical protein